MLPIRVRGRGRIAASLAASLGLVAAAGAVTTGPAQSVEPAGDCPTAFPVAELIAAVDAGQDVPVAGKTVSKGTVPGDFTGSVIGVVDSGIAPDVDMIMADLSSPALTEAGGVWSGMSGSPVYAEDGRLIGAVAYGLSYGPSTIAGITPYEEMATQLTADSAAQPARQVDLSQREAEQVAAESSVTRSEAEQGFSRLRMPRSFVGVRGALLDRAVTQAPPHARSRRYVAKNASAGTMGARASAADASSLVAGGNLGATFAHGDITAGGVGTVTAVCGDRLVGFGHPMMFSGRTTLGLHPASAVYVQPESLGAPFKMANIAAPVGTITQDRTAGISGVVGVLPETMSVTSNLTYLDQTRMGTTQVSIPGANAEMTFYQQLVNHDSVLDAFTPGSELQTWTITGTNSGKPFSISHTDRFASDYDITFESPWDVADAVWALSAMPGVVVEDVMINGQIEDQHSTWRISKLQQNLGGRWVTVSRRQPAIARAGGSLRLRARLENGTGSTTVALAIPVPTQAKGFGGFLEVVGGGSSGSWLGAAKTVGELRQALSSMAPNDAVEGQLFLEGRRQFFERRGVSRAADQVVLGHRRALVLVR